MQAQTQLPVFRDLGIREYEPVWRDMQRFTETRDENTRDEIWVLQHEPVFTLGQNGKTEHILNPGDIPVVKIDRGGQVTYHGPGQLVVYPLLDLRRLKIGVRQLVCALENAVIDTLRQYGIEAYGKRDAPGVYTEERKIAALGLRVKRGCSYHGLAFNIAMDLEPFQRINPCGYAGLEVTQTSDLGGAGNVDQAAADLKPHLLHHLRYNTASAA